MTASLFRSAGLPSFSMMQGWRAHLAALGLIVVAIMLIFLRDVGGMTAIWWHASTYGHCLFVPFLIGWLVQQRLPGLRLLEPVAWAPGLIWLAGGAFAWLVGDAAGVALFRHGGIVVMMQGAVITLLGPAVARALLFPLFYGFFMIPFGEEVVPMLQLFTAKIAMLLLGVAGVPAHIEGIFITIPNGYFEVAEACSGAKFLIAMTAYGVLAANVCFKSWPRRILFLGGALTLSVLANGVRAFATIYVAHLSTVDAAVGFDHVVYGWVFFGLVMIAVMATAWPFFDRKPGDGWFDPATLQGAVKRSRLAFIVPAALSLIAVAPIWSTAMAARASADLVAPALPQVPGWTRSDARQAYPWKPRFDGADHLVTGRYRNMQGQTIDLAIATFDRQEEGRELVGFGQGAADPASEWVWSSPAPAPGNGHGEQITAPGPVVRHVVSFYMLNGVLTGSGGEVKIQTLKSRLLGTDQRAAAILVSTELTDGRNADAAIATFLHDLGNVKDLADRSLTIR